ncbi:MAG: FAD-dependent oxidoreductase, partial [Planctomycetota bacterium]
FISKAVHNRSVDRSYGYPVPYRCFYSRNVSNLFMAGRCASVTHEALGTVRVMKTCGMMGEVVGKAASICVLHDCKPRSVYDDHLDELVRLLHFPGKAHRENPGADIVVPDDVLEAAGPYGPPTGLNPKKMAGIVVDDDNARLTGTWKSSTGLKNYIGNGYRYASPSSEATATFTIKPEKKGKYVLRLASQPHKNRAKNTAVMLRRGDFSKTYRVDQSSKYDDDMIPIDTLTVSDLRAMEVVVSAGGADGTIHIDAVQLQPVEP